MSDPAALTQPGRQYNCRCGCGCRELYWLGGYESDYCSRCRVGDCPDPDEEIPMVCACGRKSNKARIEEFGSCLHPKCNVPERRLRY